MALSPPSHSLDHRCLLDPEHSTRLLEPVSARVLIEAARRDLDIDTAAEFQGIESLGRYRCEDCALEFFSPGVTGGPAFYRTLVQQPWYQPVGKFEYNVAASLIKAGDRVLDVGCGDGRFSRLVPNARFTGLAPDGVSQSLSANARVLARSLEEHVVVDMQDAAERYDWVCAFQVLEHVADPLRFLHQALACLKPDGRLVFGLPNAESYIGGLINFALNAPPHHVTGWRDHTLSYVEQRLQLRRVGLYMGEIEEWEKVLYWLQHGYQRHRRSGACFSDDWRWRYRIPVSYLKAKALSTWGNIPGSQLGSAMVWVASRR